MALLEVKTEWAVYKDCFFASGKIPGRQQQGNRDLEQRGRTYCKNHGMYHRKRTCRG